MSFKDLGKGSAGQHSETAEQAKARADAAAAAKAKHDAKHARYMGQETGAQRGEPSDTKGQRRS